MTLKDLEALKENDKITYNDLLACKEWKNKRKEVLEKDNNKCTECGKLRTLKMWSGNNVMYFTLDKESIKNEEKIESTNIPTNLEIHHKYYILNRFPWEYNNDALITVCRDCHQKIHNNNRIYVWDEKMLNKKILNKSEFRECSRCSGKGHLHEYIHVQGGRCFKCGGSGYNIPFQFKRRS